MKKIKTAIALLLCAIIFTTSVFCGAVSAGSEDLDVRSIYVDGFYNTQNLYCLRIGNFGFNTYLNNADRLIAAGYSENDLSIWSYLDFGNNVLLAVKVYFTYDSSWNILAASYVSYNSSSSFTQFNANETLSARYYVNSDTDMGVVTFIPDGGNLLKTLKNCTTVKHYSEIKIGNDSLSQLTGWVTIMSNFTGLEDTVKETAPSNDTGSPSSNDTGTNDSKTYTKAAEYNSTPLTGSVYKYEGKTVFAVCVDSAVGPIFDDFNERGIDCTYYSIMKFKNCGKYDYTFYYGGDTTGGVLGGWFQAEGKNAPEVDWDWEYLFSSDGKTYILIWVNSPESGKPKITGKVNIECTYYIISGNKLYWGDTEKTVKLSSTLKTLDEKEKAKLNISKDVSYLDIGKISDAVYTGEAIKPGVNISFGDYSLVEGVDYSLSYKNNKNVGTASVTIKGMGDYSGSKTVNFKILPKAPKLKIKGNSSKTGLYWTSTSGADKYQILYSTDGKSFKTFKTFSADETKFIFSNSKLEKKNYIFKIRAYKEDSGKKIYSDYSNEVKLSNKA